MTTPLDYLPPPPGRRFSGRGAASFALGLATLVVYFFMLTSRVTAGAPPPQPPWWVPVVALALMLGCPLVGLVLGIASLRTPGRRRGLAIAGLALNGLLLLLPLAGVMLYILRRGRSAQAERPVVIVATGFMCFMLPTGRDTIQPHEPDPSRSRDHGGHALLRGHAGADSEPVRPARPRPVG